MEMKTKIEKMVGNYQEEIKAHSKAIEQAKLQIEKCIQAINEYRGAIAACQQMLSEEEEKKDEKESE